MADEPLEPYEMTETEILQECVRLLKDRARDARMRILLRLVVILDLPLSERHSRRPPDRPMRIKYGGPA